MATLEAVAHRPQVRPGQRNAGDRELLHGTDRRAFNESFGRGFVVGPHGVGSATAVGMSGGSAQKVLSRPKTQLLCRGTVNLPDHSMANAGAV